MKCLLILFIFICQFSRYSFSVAQAETDTFYVLVNDAGDFNESVWSRDKGEILPTITAYNCFFETAQAGSLKKFLFTLFILPDKNRKDAEWVAQPYEVLKDHIFSKKSMIDEVLFVINDAALPYSRTVLLHNILPLIKKNGKYYSVKNFVFGQCWEIISESIKSPRDAKTSTINTKATIFSKNEIDTFKNNEISALITKTGNQSPIGVKNIHADLVFLREKDIINNFFTFEYLPRQSFDSSFLLDGIVKFIYSPCVGIIGGTFNTYFASLSMNPDTHKLSNIQYGGMYKAKLIDRLNSKIYLRQNCK